jgi:aspartate dehydrogenase
MRTVGLIGAGKIGRPVIDAFERGAIEGHELVGVLTRTGDEDAFWKASPDIIIEAAGGDAFREHGARAIETADLWVASGAALADPTFRDSLVAIATRSGHELRVLTGALAGLDAIATAAVDPDMMLSLQLCIGPGDGPRQTVFEGLVSEAAERFPEDVNVSVAAALAGHGPERTQIEVIQPGPGEPRELRYRVTSRYGDFETLSVPMVDPANNIHVVAANMIASLNGETTALRVR